MSDLLRHLGTVEHIPEYTSAVDRICTLLHEQRFRYLQGVPRECIPLCLRVTPMDITVQLHAKEIIGDIGGKLLIGIADHTAATQESMLACCLTDTSTTEIIATLPRDQHVALYRTAYSARRIQLEWLKKNSPVPPNIVLQERIDAIVDRYENVVRGLQ